MWRSYVQRTKRNATSYLSAKAILKSSPATRNPERVHYFRQIRAPQGRVTQVLLTPVSGGPRGDRGRGARSSLRWLGDPLQAIRRLTPDQLADLVATNALRDDMFATQLLSAAGMLDPANVPMG